MVDAVTGAERPSRTRAAQVADQEHRLLVELASGAAVSVVLGGLAWGAGRATGCSPARSFGSQTLAWAAVDGALAGGGLLAASRRGPVDEPARRVRLLRRVLRVNTGLDVGYVLGGALWAWRRPERLGDGVAVMVQGAFLLWLDARHAAALGRL